MLSLTQILKSEFHRHRSVLYSVCDLVHVIHFIWFHSCKEKEAVKASELQSRDGKSHQRGKYYMSFINMWNRITSHVYLSCFSCSGMKVWWRWVKVKQLGWRSSLNGRTGERECLTQSILYYWSSGLLMLLIRFLSSSFTSKLYCTSCLNRFNPESHPMPSWYLKLNWCLLINDSRSHSLLKHKTTSVSLRCSFVSLHVVMTMFHLSHVTLSSSKVIFAWL